jgi:histidinol-phosphate phosphatase family protein
MSDDAPRAVFIDKDGTLVENVPYNADPAQIRLTPGAGAALVRLREAGFRLFVVSNQSGVARGLFPIEALDGVERRLRELLAADGATIDAFAWCPHHPEGTVAPYAVACDCRKPAPGMILRLAREHGVDLARSWMIGDTPNDVEAAHRAGCRAVLLDNGGETEWLRDAPRDPDSIVPDLAAAADVILACKIAPARKS